MSIIPTSPFVVPPPLIPSSGNLYSSQSSLEYISDQPEGIPFSYLSSNIITDSIATLESGTLSNLITVTSSASSDYAVNKQYVDQSYGVSAVGTQGAIQFNNAGSFSSSSLLTFDNQLESNISIGVLNVNAPIVSGFTMLSGSTLLGLIDPTTRNQAATKHYVDNINNKTISQIGSFLSQIYTASQVVNGIIFRSGLIINDDSSGSSDMSLRTIDYFPTASSIVNILINENKNPAIGTTFTFNIYNITPYGNVSLIIQPIDSSVVFDPVNITIFGSYQLSMTGIVLSIYPPKVLMNIIETSFINNIPFVRPGYNDPQWALQYKTNTSTDTSYTNNNSGPVMTTARSNTQLLLPGQPDIINSNLSYTYAYSDISSRLIIRSGFTTPITDTFVSSTLFFDNVFFNGYTAGLGMEFAIQNTSSTNLILNPGTGWTFFNNNTFTIPNGYTGYFRIDLDQTNMICTLYLIGNFSRI